MDKSLKIRILTATIAVAIVFFASCEKDETSDLNGTVTISPTTNVFVGDELTAAYSGTEVVTWQWNKDGIAINGASGEKYTSTKSGNYTVTASATGYNSKTSVAVEVKDIQDLSGTISIRPTDAFTGDELNAAYSGSETVTWQWNKSGTAINGATSDKYTPIEAGSYTVTASATAYNSMTSAAIEVKPVFLPEEMQDDNYRYVYEYDNRNRITKCTIYYPFIIAVSTFTYNADGDLVEMNNEVIGYPEHNSKTTFTKNGNKITFITHDNFLYEIELNDQGLPLKITREIENENGFNWYYSTFTFIWENRNITHRKVEEIADVGGNTIGPFTATSTYTYDDKKSPFYHCNTPKWFLWYWFSFSIELCNENNIKTVTSLEYGDIFEYEYKYNEDGFPKTRTAYGHSEMTYTYKKR